MTASEDRLTRAANAIPRGRFDFGYGNGDERPVASAVLAEFAPEFDELERWRAAEAGFRENAIRADAELDLFRAENASLRREVESWKVRGGWTK